MNTGDDVSVMRLDYITICSFTSVMDEESYIYPKRHQDFRSWSTYQEEAAIFGALSLTPGLKRGR